MDSYTDVREQCCGRMGNPAQCRMTGRGSQSGRQTDNRDMGMNPWNAWNTRQAYSYPVGTGQAAAGGMCPNTRPGSLEQNYMVAMAYVPWQQWQTTYAPERGFTQGTIFPELDLQFRYGRCGE